ncbi:MAG: Na+/H+ antiporter NhaA, partial [Nocardioides sp.]|nr:Na+/H+ antiporter NhaA [Nocardioides sp.]
VLAAALAIVIANTPIAGAYFDLRDTAIGYEPWHLHLTVGEWAADGLLAIFFFLVGLELKREFVAGDLRDPQRALVPVAAAFGGVVAPALIYTAINLGTDASRGWAVPTATDIAFAVAVLAIIGSHLPSALRIFLLTLAVVDDLIAITIIAIFYTSDLSFGPLLLAAVPLAAFAFLTHRCRRFFGLHAWAAWVILLPLGIVVWALVHSSGIHATVAGVLLGFAVPVIRSQASGGPEAGPGLAEVFEHRFRPISTGIAVPVFAFFSAGVAIGGIEGVRATLTDTVSLGVIAGLVLGKPIGILGTTWLVTSVTRSRLDSSLKWIDMLGVSLLAGIGFTVSLLVAELSFGHSAHNDHAKVAILTASVLAAVLGAIVLTTRNGHYKRLEIEQSTDSDQDGVPDAYTQES